jgi:hypothetical protein
MVDAVSGEALVCIAECPEFGLITCSGKASWVVWSRRLAARWVALFFYTVNQVLVRLWARVTELGLWSSDHGLMEVPSFGRLV